MSKEKPAPYICHIFVCIKSRQGERKSCADGDSPAVKSILKKEIKSRGWADRVRISECGCLGLCPHGPNVIIYPQKIWFSGVTESDIPNILVRVEAELSAGDTNRIARSYNNTER